MISYCLLFSDLPEPDDGNDCWRGGEPKGGLVDVVFRGFSGFFPKSFADFCSSESESAKSLTIGSFSFSSWFEDSVDSSSSSSSPFSPSPSESDPDWASRMKGWSRFAFRRSLMRRKRILTCLSSRQRDTPWAEQLQVEKYKEYKYILYILKNILYDLLSLY